MFPSSVLSPSFPSTPSTSEQLQNPAVIFPIPDLPGHDLAAVSSCPFNRSLLGSVPASSGPSALWVASPPIYNNYNSSNPLRNRAEQPAPGVASSLQHPIHCLEELRPTVLQHVSGLKSHEHDVRHARATSSPSFDHCSPSKALERPSSNSCMSSSTPHSRFRPEPETGIATQTSRNGSSPHSHDKNDCHTRAASSPSFEASHTPLKFHIYSFLHPHSKAIILANHLRSAPASNIEVDAKRDNRASAPCDAVSFYSLGVRPGVHSSQRSSRSSQPLWEAPPPTYNDNNDCTTSRNSNPGNSSSNHSMPLPQKLRDLLSASLAAHSLGIVSTSQPASFDRSSLAQSSLGLPPNEAANKREH